MGRSKPDTSFDPFGDTSKACRRLARRDPGLKIALKAIEAPVIRRRAGGFEGLFRIIVEQQVSVASAQAVWRRCLEGLDRITPVAALGADETRLRALGLSGPKARYVRALAEAVHGGRLDLDALPALSDRDASAALQSVKGIGPWTAAIYLLFCEGRVDIWPPGDVALQQSFTAACGRPERMSMAELDETAAGWAPYRGLAAHILWTYYAHLRGRQPI